VNRRNRQSIRLKGYDYAQAGAYFVTICTQGRVHLFGDVVDGEMVLNDAGRMVFDQWMGLTQRFDGIQLNECIIMPNHMHGIIEILSEPVGVGLVPTLGNRATTTERATTNRATTNRATTRVAPTAAVVALAAACATVGDMVGVYKSLTTNAYIHGVKQLGWERFNQKLWQRNYWEHIVRDASECQRIATYIRNNPAQWEMDQLNKTGDEMREPHQEYAHEVWMV